MEESSAISQTFSAKELKDLISLQNDYIIVKKNELNQLYHEVKQIKKTLPGLLNKDFINAPLKIHQAEQKYLTLNAENTSLKRELEMLRKRYDGTLNEVEREKKGNALLRQQVTELTDVTNKQSEYCAKLGSTTCALLWKASQQENCMHSVLSGEHGKEFILLATHTLESYSAAAQENVIDNANDSTDSEHHFIVALMGVITNISASAFGREFLMTCEYGNDLLSLMIAMISDLPSTVKLMKLKNLVLRTLYNISINQKGIKLLCSKRELFQNLSFVIGEKCSNNRLLALRLIQSIIVEPDCVEAFHIILELFPIEMLEKFSLMCGGELQGVFRELIKDLTVLVQQ